VGKVMEAGGLMNAPNEAQMRAQYPQSTFLHGLRSVYPPAEHEQLDKA
jgi:hypothetical protein